MSRCPICNKKIKLTDIQCKCGIIFCSLHRYPDMHDCSFNFKVNERNFIEKNNPKIIPNKITKI
ncbi:AN1-like Zinc finger containing protein [Chrysochromulina ericina virus CeV-01B]|uniref:AN1-like Zinc finger containing protein n=1 Tax=Chrysochromulina ericina virus CeV-01B TaxID=3070830 RepID=A0A0N9R1L4_9VIRU|nr:AN1-like Zinc finger containing protein [Chrysochromulina ericina virus]ALH23333.1 AN1-like Zinc finger containing protein [Chrysochromulina ericina virus CeV-01B]